MPSPGQRPGAGRVHEARAFRVLPARDARGDHGTPRGTRGRCEAPRGGAEPGPNDELPARAAGGVDRSRRGGGARRDPRQRRTRGRGDDAAERRARVLRTRAARTAPPRGDALDWTHRQPQPRDLWGKRRARRPGGGAPRHAARPRRRNGGPRRRRRAGRRRGRFLSLLPDDGARRGRGPDRGSRSARARALATDQRLSRGCAPPR